MKYLKDEDEAKTGVMQISKKILQICIGYNVENSKAGCIWL